MNIKNENAKSIIREVKEISDVIAIMEMMKFPKDSFSYECISMAKEEMYRAQESLYCSIGKIVSIECIEQGVENEKHNTDTDTLS